MPRLVIALLALAIAIGKPLAAPSQGGQPLSLAWPFALEVGRQNTAGPGEARFQVRIDRGSVVAVVPRSGEPQFVAIARRTLETWRLGPGWDGSWETTIRHVLEGSSGCEQDFNQIIRATIPTSISVTSKKSVTICDPSVESSRFLAPVAEISGVIMCQCPDQVLGGTDLLLTGPGGRRRIRTDRDGRFRFSGLAPGEYRLRLLAEAYARNEYRFTVAADGHKNELELHVVPDPIRPVDTIVVGGSIPIYPIHALELSQAGSVDLRLSMRNNDVLDVDAKATSSELAAAATATVRTWRFQATHVPVLHVRFTYRLAEGHCETAPHATVEMRLPHDVLVVSPRKCSAER